MSYTAPEKFTNVTAACKANIYFDGKVVSHTIVLADGRRKTFGLVYPGSYKFDTKVPEVMEIIAGSCRVLLAGEEQSTDYAPGSFFKVPGNSSFTIEVKTGITEYVCSFE